MLCSHMAEGWEGLNYFLEPFLQGVFHPQLRCPPRLSPPFHVTESQKLVWGNIFNHRKSLLLYSFFEAGSGTHLGDQTGLKLAFTSWVLLLKMCALLIFQKDNLVAYKNLEPTFIHVSTYLAYEKLTSPDLGRAQNSIIQTAEKTAKLYSTPRLHVSITTWFTSWGIWNCYPVGAWEQV